MNVKTLFKEIEKRLQKAGVTDPAFDTIYIFEHFLDMSRTDIAICGDKEVDDDKAQIMKLIADKRCDFQPLQYLLGEWEFMGRTYKVGDGVLIPRDDTQVVVDACAELLRNCDNATVVDLCSGSGIIAITLKKMFKNATIYAVEKSSDAFSYLTENYKLNDADINIINADLYECHSEFENGSLDMIVSNPPYIISDEIKTLQKEVQKEPTMALDGGEDGYDFYRGIINLWSVKLKTGGIIAFEIGEGQFDYIKNLLIASGFVSIKGYLDIAGTTRAVTAIYNP